MRFEFGTSIFVVLLLITVYGYKNHFENLMQDDYMLPVKHVYNKFMHTAVIPVVSSPLILNVIQQRVHGLVNSWNRRKNVQFYFKVLQVKMSQRPDRTEEFL